MLAYRRSHVHYTQQPQYEAPRRSILCSLYSHRFSACLGHKSLPWTGGQVRMALVYTYAGALRTFRDCSLGTCYTLFANKTDLGRSLRLECCLP